MYLERYKSPLISKMEPEGWTETMRLVYECSAEFGLSLEEYQHALVLALDANATTELGALVCLLIANKLQSSQHQLHV